MKYKEKMAILRVDGTQFLLAYLIISDINGVISFYSCVVHDREKGEFVLESMPLVCTSPFEILVYSITNAHIFLRWRISPMTA